MIRNFFRHLIESFKSLKRNGWMTLASVSAVTVTLILVGVFLSVILNVSKLAKDIEKDVNVSVFVDIGVKGKDLTAIGDQLEEIKGVKKVTYSSKEEQYKELVKKFGSSWKLFDKDSNPLYDVYIVSASNPDSVKSIQKKAADLKNVYKADYGGLSSDKILAFSKSTQRWGLIASALLLFIAIFLISNTIRITIISRQREISIMRLVGARNGYIRWPFFIEGAWIGLLGAVVPVLLMTFGYQQAYVLISKGLMNLNYTLLSPDYLVIRIDIIMALIGVLIGSIGSILSMRRFLKV